MNVQASGYALSSEDIQQQLPQIFSKNTFMKRDLQEQPLYCTQP